MKADIVVVGGGITGLAFALLAARCGFLVHIIDEQTFQPLTTIEDYLLRVSAITPISKDLFQALGIWPTINTFRFSAFQKIEVWEEMSGAKVHFDCQALAQPALGYIVENLVMQTALYAQVKAHHAIQYDAATTLQSFESREKNITVTLGDGRSIQAMLLVGADGACSQVRTLANIAIHEKAYAQQALIATIKTTLPHQATARQKFLNSGPLAFLPLSDPYACSIVWSHEKTMHLAAQSETVFNAALQQASDNVLGQLTLVRERKIFPLTKRHVTDYVLPRIALMGDAAHTLHPLAGQGANLGLQDALALAEILYTLREQRRDIGLLRHLKAYERRRKSENQLMLAATDAFYHLFRQKQPGLSVIRHWGLQLTERYQPIKNALMQKAMGLSEHLPRWLLSEPRRI